MSTQRTALLSTRFLQGPILIFYTLSWALSNDVIFYLVFLGIFATGIAYSLFTFGLKYLSPSTAVTLSVIEPITAVILSVIFLGEVFSITQYLAILVIILGLFLSSKSEAV